MRTASIWIGGSLRAAGRALLRRSDKRDDDATETELAALSAVPSEFAAAAQVAAQCNEPVPEASAPIETSSVSPRQDVGPKLCSIERTRLLESSEREYAQLREVINALPAVISVKDLDGRYLLVNRRFEEQHRRKASDVIGKTTHEVFPAQFADRLRSVDQRVIEGRAPLQEEALVPLSKGIHTMLSTKAPLVDDKGVVYAVCGVHVDITERKHAEQDLQIRCEKLESQVERGNAELQRALASIASLNKRLQEAQMQLVQAEKMASIGAIAGGAATEIERPISVAGTKLGTLNRHIADLLSIVDEYEQVDAMLCTTDPERHARVQSLKARVHLDDLRSSATQTVADSSVGLIHAAKIARDLKDLAFTGSGDWQLTDLHASLDRMLDLARHEFRYKAEVVRDYGRLPKVECLPAELSRVFMNLIVNAARAMDEMGQLRIFTAVEQNGVRVEISDTGGGIAPEDLKHVFEPASSPLSMRGSRLGHCNAIVQKHKGKMEARSRLGQGSTFSVWLPAVQS